MVNSVGRIVDCRNGTGPKNNSPIPVTNEPANAKQIKNDGNLSQIFPQNNAENEYDAPSATNIKLVCNVWLDIPSCRMNGSNVAPLKPINVIAVMMMNESIKTIVDERKLPNVTSGFSIVVMDESFRMFDVSDDDEDSFIGTINAFAHKKK